MPPRQTEEEQADFASALRLIADEEPLPQAEVDTLSMLEGPDLASFRDVWSGLSAPARARLIRALQNAAEARLRLDFGALNRLALVDDDPIVRLAAIQAGIEDRSLDLLDHLLEIVAHDRH